MLKYSNYKFLTIVVITGYLITGTLCAIAENSSPDLYKKFASAVNEAEWYLDLAKKYDSFKDDALQKYNELRDLASEPQADSLNDIDYQWLDEQRYRAWVYDKKNTWAAAGKTAINDQKKDLLYYALSSWVDDKEKLFAYNLLRSWMNLPLSSSIESRDEEWLKEQDYELWKAEKQEDFKQRSKKSLLAQVADLAWYTEYSLEHREPNEPADSYHTKSALYNYNFLRELLHKDKVKDVAQIDREWIDEVLKDSKALEIMEKNDYGEATFAQKELVKQAQKIINLEEDLKVFEHNTFSGGSASSDFVTLCKTPDLDYTLAVLYHELGHIAYKDFMRKLGLNGVEEALEAPEMKEAIAQITSYLNKGKSVVDATTELGKRLLKFMQKNPVFWIPPRNHDSYLRSLLSMNQERRADLFMLNKLYAQGNINAILSDLYQYGESNRIIAHEDAKHPSDIERALYMIGFLADKNIDVNAAIKKWEQEAICTSREELFAGLPKPHRSKGAQDLQEAYKPYQEQNAQQKYEEWKKEELEKFKSDDLSLAQQIQDLLYQANAHLAENQKEETNFRTKYALYNYNLARELLKEPVAKTIREIDVKWIDNQDYTLFKQEKHRDFTDENSDFIDQILMLGDAAKYHLAKYEEDPNNNYHQGKRALYHYNFARELLKQPIAKNIQNIDKKWVDAQIDNFKKQRDSTKNKTGTGFIDYLKSWIG